MKHDQEKESSDIVISTEISIKKIQLICELYRSEGIGALLKQKMRPGVQTILTSNDGAEFAANNYFAICQHIINCALKLHFPDQVTNLNITKEQVEKTQKNYPLQLQMVKSVIDSVD